MAYTLNILSAKSLFHSTLCHMLLNSLLCIIWTLSRIKGPNKNLVQTMLVLVSYVCFMAGACYLIALIPCFERVFEVADHEIAEDPEMKADEARITTMLTFTGFMSRTIMLTLKLNYLLIYYQMIHQFPSRRRYVQYAMAFFIGAAVCFGFLRLFSCGSPANITSLTACATPAALTARDVLFYGEYSFDVFEYLIIMIPPLIVISKLQTTTAKKIISGAVFFFGLIFISAATTKLVLATLWPERDRTPGFITVAFVTVLEVTLAVLCNFAPSIYMWTVHSWRKRHQPPPPPFFESRQRDGEEEGAVEWHQMLRRDRARTGTSYESGKPLVH